MKNVILFAICFSMINFAYAKGEEDGITFVESAQVKEPEAVASFFEDLQVAESFEMVKGEEKLEEELGDVTPEVSSLKRTGPLSPSRNIAQLAIAREVGYLVRGPGLESGINLGECKSFNGGRTSACIAGEATGKQ